MADPLTTQDVTLYDENGNVLKVVAIGSDKVLMVTLPDGLIIPVTISEDNWSTLVKAGKGFVVTSNTITVAPTTEYDFLLIKNPAASGKYVRFKELLVSIESSTTQGSVIRIYRNPTITTNGTALTINKLRLAQNDPVALAYTAPTLSGRGTLLEVMQIGLGVFVRDLNISRFLEEGENFLITVQGTKVNVVHSITALWAESAVSE